MPKLPIGTLGRARALLLSATLTLVLSACATPVYRKEVTAFTTATAAMEAKARALEQQGRAGREPPPWRVELLTEQGVRTTGDCDGAAGPCVVVFSGIDRIAADGAGTTDDVTARLDGVLKGLTAYGDALVAITDAADQQDFRTAAAALSGSCGSLAEAGVGVRCTGVEEAAGVLTELGAALLERRRFEALHAAVTTVHPQLEAMEIPFAETIDSLRRVAVRNAKRFLTDDADTLNAMTDGDRRVPPAAYAAAYRAVAAQQRELAALQALKPAELVGAWVAAHRELAEAVAAGRAVDEKQRRALLEALKALATAVAALEASVDGDG